MSLTPRPIPMEIRTWIEKDITLNKLSARSGLMPNTTKENAVLNRNFFTDMFSLSSERYRTMNRFDLDKNIFLQHQRSKAEIGMPGLLPYIEQSTPASSRSLASSILTLNKTDQIVSSAFQPHSTRQSEAVKKNDKLQSIPSKARSIRQQQSLERLNRLAQPRGRPYYTTDHIRAHYLQPLTVKDLFGELDEVSNCNSTLSDRTRATISDARFQQLLETCSEVHAPGIPANVQTVETIVQSNPSLQDNEGRWQTANKPPSRTVELKKHIKKLNKQFSTKSSIHLIDLCTC